MAGINQLRQALIEGSSSSTFTPGLNYAFNPISEPTNFNYQNQGQGTNLLFPQQIISNVEYPPNPNQPWSLTPLYVIDQLGKQRIWHIGFDPRTSELIIIHGQVGGAIQTDRTEVKLNQSGRNITEQALLQARKKYDDKYHANYRPLGSTDPVPLKIQLANKYYLIGEIDKERSEKEGTTVLATEAKSRVKIFPVFIEPKLNGTRARAQLRGNEIAFISRSTKKEYIQYDHVKPELFNFFSFLPPGVDLDGEMYQLDTANDIEPENVKQERLQSITQLRKTQHPQAYRITYCIFDIIMLNTPTEIRYKLLLQAFKAYRQTGYVDNTFKIVAGYLVYSHQQISQYAKQFLKQKCEGLIIRHVAFAAPGNQKHYQQSLYKGGRNNNMLKYRQFEEEDGVIVDVTGEESEGREQYLAIFHIRDKNGVVFPMRPSGTFEERESWLLNKNQIIGLTYTFEFEMRSTYGVPLKVHGGKFRPIEDIGLPGEET